MLKAKEILHFYCYIFQDKAFSNTCHSSAYHWREDPPLFECLSPRSMCWNCNFQIHLNSTWRWGFWRQDLVRSWGGAHIMTLVVALNCLFGIGAPSVSLSWPQTCSSATGVYHPGWLISGKKLELTCLFYVVMWHALPVASRAENQVISTLS